MRGRLYELDKVVSFDPPPPKDIIQDGKHFEHCGVLLPEGVHVYRHRVWGGERTLARAEGWVPDNRFKCGGYYRRGYGDRA